METFDDITVMLPAIPVIPTTTVPELKFPQLYIVAPKLRGMEVYEIEKAPAWAFDAWCHAVARSNIVYDFAQAAKTLRIDRGRWNCEERYQMINQLAENLGERGVSLPLYNSRTEANRALIAMEVL